MKMGFGFMETVCFFNNAYTTESTQGAREVWGVKFLFVYT